MMMQQYDKKTDGLPPDDGRRHMPKLKCPHCGGRVADAAGKRIRNESALVKLTLETEAAYILECPHCHRTVGLCIRSLCGQTR